MVQLWHHRRSRILYRTESCSTAPKGGNRRNEAVVSMRKKGSKQSKVSRIDRSKALRLRMWFNRKFGGDADGQGEKAGHEAE